MLGSVVTAPVIAEHASVQLNIVVVYGIPGHSAVHLQRGSQQLYWDPGGFYGTEYDNCVEFNSAGACRRFRGFPWEHLKTSRRNDVFLGDNADLLQILSIYHLDGDPGSEIYTITLNGALAERAWQLLDEGRRHGHKAAFRTDRQPMFCVKAVAAYLDALGGDFKDMPRPWFPRLLAAELQKRDIALTASYSINSAAIEQYIDNTRQAANLSAMFSSIRTDLASHLTGPP